MYFVEIWQKFLPQHPTLVPHQVFFGGPFAKFIVGNAKLIVAFFVMLTIATTAVWVNLLVPDPGEVDWLPQ